MLPRSRLWIPELTWKRLLSWQGKISRSIYARWFPHCDACTYLQVAKVFAAHWKDMEIPVLEEVSPEPLSLDSVQSLTFPPICTQDQFGKVDVSHHSLYWVDLLLLLLEWRLALQGIMLRWFSACVGGGEGAGANVTG
jgi:hypothetical protein